MFKFLLEVCGPPVIIWGGSEILMIRTENTQELWRYLSIGIGFLSFIRFFINKKCESVKKKNNDWFLSTNTR